MAKKRPKRLKMARNGRKAKDGPKMARNGQKAKNGQK